MTRDEAIKICQQFWGDGAENAIDVLERLGVLNLDKRTPRQRAADALTGGRIGYPVVFGPPLHELTGIEAHSILGMLDAAGLEIVKKDTVPFGIKCTTDGHRFNR